MLFQETAGTTASTGNTGAWLGASFEGSEVSGLSWEVLVATGMYACLASQLPAQLL